MRQEVASEAAAEEARRQRRADAKEERELAAAVHKAELLWMLARGLLFDAAADDELLQAHRSPLHLSLCPLILATNVLPYLSRPCAGRTPQGAASISISDHTATGTNDAVQAALTPPVHVFRAINWTAWA